MSTDIQQFHRSLAVLSHQAVMVADHIAFIVTVAGPALQVDIGLVIAQAHVFTVDVMARVRILPMDDPTAGDTSAVTSRITISKTDELAEYTVKLSLVIHVSILFSSGSAAPSQN